MQAHRKDILFNIPIKIFYIINIPQYMLTINESSAHNRANEYKIRK